MKSLIHILFIGWLVFAGFTTLASGDGKVDPILFTDRGFCVSGDSVWVMLKLPVLSENDGEVVRFQLESASGNLIEQIAVVSHKGWADGFVTIPDSLGSGQYFVTAFLLNQGNRNIQPITKSLIVYNRFDEDISQINFLEGEPNQVLKSEVNSLEIKTNQEVYNTRDEVNVNLELPVGFDVSEAVIRAAFIDPLEERATGYRFNYQFSQPPEAGFIEKNGYLVSGKVSDIAGVPQSGVLVVISLPALSGYFDYCVSDSTGTFHFFLKNAFGTTDAIFQVFSESQKKFLLRLENGALHRIDKVQMETVVLNTEQTAVIKNALSSSFASHVFYPANLAVPGFFSMEAPDSIPFYGTPALRVHPEEFIDLPDFREISRELLHGFQYRIRDEKIVFRMVNRTRGEMFREEPLRLINGIPVFENQLFASLKSTDIEYIDLMLTERIYGEMIFSGVIHVSLKDKSNTWLAQQSNLFSKSIALLQPLKERGDNRYFTGADHEPDTRQVFIWEKISGKPEDFSFGLSDRKGVVEISIEGYSAENQYFKSTKTVEVK